MVGGWSQERSGMEMMNVRTWYGQCVHPKMYVVPECIQAIIAHANLRRLTLCLGIALHFLEEPPYRAAPHDDFHVRVVEHITVNR
jgi:hypothetical protein